jgi:hypothetical protein
LALSAGAIVGIAVGAGAIILFSVLLAWFFFARRRRRRERSGLAGLPGPAPGEKSERWAYYGRSTAEEGGMGKVMAVELDTTPAELGSEGMVFEADHRGPDRPRHEMG